MRLLILGLAALVSAAQVGTFPVSDVRPGLRGVGKTVFAGNTVEEFEVELLGVLENSGPKQSIILGRLSGGPIERTGVLEGMSGSPVYVDGRLLGAVALAFQYSTEPIAGIRPIEEMLRIAEPAATGAVSLGARDLASVLPPRQDVLAGTSRLVEIATPVSFSGFTRGTIEQFAPQLRRLGLEPAQGLSGGGRMTGRMGDPSSIEPGSMISVLLVSGDMSIGADGTVTHIDGDRVYAFGHSFLSVGATELPFTRSEVITLAPNLTTSFKISSALEQVGAITGDYSTAVTGVLGRSAATIPVSISVDGPERAAESYQLRIVNDRYLSAILLQMSVYSAIQATERTLGAGTVVLRGAIRFEGGEAPVRLDDIYAGEANVPMEVSLGAAVPLGYLMQGGFESLRLAGIDVAVDVYAGNRSWQIENVWPSGKTVRAGEEAVINVVLAGEDGAEQVHQVRYQVPVGTPTGPLYFTVADAGVTNVEEYAHLVTTRMRTATQMVSLLNDLRRNRKAYVRVWRADPGYSVGGRNMPSPPASVALILGRGGELGGASLGYTSRFAELEIDTGDAVVTGSKTIQVEVKE